MTRRGRIGTGLLVVSAAAILAATLMPLPSIPVDALEHCDRCRGVNLADLAANLILFLPLGIGVAIRGNGWRFAVILACVLSTGVELAQVSFVSGRDAALVDVAMNTLGAAAGWSVIALAGHWLAPPPRVARVMSLAVAAMGAVGFVATGWLVAPSFPEAAYYAQWTPDLGYLEWYRGTVEEAHVGPFAAPDGRFADSVPIRDLLLRGAPIDVQARAGPPVPRLGSLFSVYDDRHREIVLVGPDRSDLVIRVRTRAFALGLDQPILMVPGALAGIDAGKPLGVGVSRTGAETCVRVNQRTTCGLGFTVGLGWAFVQYPRHLPSAVRVLLGIGWIGGLTLLAGFWARRGVPAAFGAALLAATAAAAPLYGLLATGLLEWLGGLAGWGLGVMLGRATRRRLGCPDRP